MATSARVAAVTISFRLCDGYGLAGRPLDDGQPLLPASANTFRGPVKRGVAPRRRNPRPALSFWRGGFLGKKYRHLIDRIVTDDNMRSAYQKTARGRRFTHGALAFKEYVECNLGRLAYDLHTGNYQPGTPNTFYVYEPKARLITALPFRDRVAQHALCNVIGPVFERTFLPRSFACREGKGTHAGVIALQAELRRMSRYGPVYFLKTDFSRYFPSIDRSVLHGLIRQKISCATTMQIIESMVPPEGIGLTIGSLTSQLFANVYGGSLDRFLQQELLEPAWYRYMDDLVVLGHDAGHLRRVKEEIERFSACRLGLRFSKWSVASVSRGVNFLGYRIWPTHKLLRRQSVVKAKRKIMAFRAAGRTDDLQRFLAAWTGHAQWADVQNLLRSLERKALL